jgi:hypothetical protein
MLYVEVSEKCRDWVVKNPWFGRNKVATDRAMKKHFALIERGVVPESDEYWEAFR